MFGLCCFAQSDAGDDGQTAKAGHRPIAGLLEEPATDLEAFKQGLRSLSSPTSSFQKISTHDPATLAAFGGCEVSPSSFPSFTASIGPSSRHLKKGKHAAELHLNPHDVELFERRQFEAYKEEVEKRRRLQLIERQMALFNTWEFYNEQEMWDLLLRYNQYMQTGHQIFLTPMPDCPVHGHSVATKQRNQPPQQTPKEHHRQQQQQQQQQHGSSHNLPQQHKLQQQQQSAKSVGKRSQQQKPSKKLKARVRRHSSGSATDNQSSSPYASHYSDAVVVLPVSGGVSGGTGCHRRPDSRSRSSLTSQVSAEIHTTDEPSAPNSLCKSVASDQPLNSDSSEKDSGIEKGSINSSFGHASDTAATTHRTSIVTTSSVHAHQTAADEQSSPPAPGQKPATAAAANGGCILAQQQLVECQEENDYDLDVLQRPENSTPEESCEATEYRDYRHRVYYSKQDETSETKTLGAMWDCSPTMNAYEDMDEENTAAKEDQQCATEDGLYQPRPPIRSVEPALDHQEETNASLNAANDITKNANDDHLHSTPRLRSLFEGPSIGERDSHISDPSHTNARLETNPIRANLKLGLGEPEFSSPGSEQEQQQPTLTPSSASATAAMAQSFNATSTTLAGYNYCGSASHRHRIVGAGSLERRQAYSKVNKDTMQIYELSASVHERATATCTSASPPPPPPPAKRIVDAYLHDELNFYDDSEHRPEHERLATADRPVSTAPQLASGIRPRRESEPADVHHKRIGKADSSAQDGDSQTAHLPPPMLQSASSYFALPLSRPHTPEQEPDLLTENHKSSTCDPPTPTTKKAADSLPVVDHHQQPKCLNVGKRASAVAAPAECATTTNDDAVTTSPQRRGLENDVGLAAGAATGSGDRQPLEKTFDLPKLRNASERKITPIIEESDLSIRTEIQKAITKLHKTGGWRKATCASPGEPYLTLDLRKETKADPVLKGFELPVSFVQAAPLQCVELQPVNCSELSHDNASNADSMRAKEREQSEIDMEALDFKRARETLKKFANDGTNPLLKQMPSHCVLATGVIPSSSELVSVATKQFCRAKLTKTLSAPPDLRQGVTINCADSTSTSTERSSRETSKTPWENETLPTNEANSATQARRSPQETTATGYEDEFVRDEEADRINFKAARETLQKFTSLNNGAFFMTDRKHRQKQL